MNIDSTYLKELQHKKWQIKKTSSSLDSARSLLPDAERKVEDLKRFFDNERREAENAEKGNVVTFVYGIFGKKDQLIEDERREAYEAENAYKTAVYELNVIEIDIRRSESELQEQMSARDEFDKLISEKKELLMAAASPKAGEISSLEDIMRTKEEILRRHETALADGRLTLFMTDELISVMKDAESWAYQCTVGGDVKATWEEQDNRNNALFRATNLAAKTKEQSDTFNGSLKNTDIEKEITFDLTIFEFKDPEIEWFYGNSGLYSDVEYAHRCTVAYKEIILPVISELENMVSFMTDEHETATKNYENAIINA